MSQQIVIWSTHIFQLCRISLPDLWYPPFTRPRGSLSSSRPLISSFSDDSSFISARFFNVGSPSVVCSFVMRGSARFINSFNPFDRITLVRGCLPFFFFNLFSFLAISLGVKSQDDWNFFFTFPSEIFLRVFYNVLGSTIDISRQRVLIKAVHR